MKYFLYTVFAVVILGLVVFVAGLADLEYTKFFLPRKENVKREVFENTKSYTHGKVQDLAKHYEEYVKSDDVTEKAAIESIIKMQFANFNSDVIDNHQLKSFLVSVRGY